MKIKLVAVLLLLKSIASGDVFVTVWDKPKRKDTENYVYGVDADTGKALWEGRLPAEANFVTVVDDGALVGTDGGTVFLLRVQTGEVIWECRVGGKHDAVDQLRQTVTNGYILSSGENVYWLVSKEGKLVWTLR